MKMHKERHTSSNGFTIAELLVVVVVIAILAAITIVAYNGIQTRAKQTANIAAVASYTKALQLMKADTGSLPTGNGTNSSCLGPDPQPAGCGYGGQNAVGGSAYSVATKSQLTQYGLTAQPTLGTVNGGHAVYTDAFFGQPALLWQVPADQDCVSTSARFYSSSAWTDGLKYSSRSGTATVCYMSLATL